MTTIDLHTGLKTASWMNVYFLDNFASNTYAEDIINLFKLITISLALAVFVTPCIGWSQQDSWEEFIDRGNRALSEGALFQAEVYYLQAIEVSEIYTPDDLRRATARRNLAHAYMLQGRFIQADSVYREAFLTANRILGNGHPYVLSIQDEIARLHEAMAQRWPPDNTDLVQSSDRNVTRNLMGWLVQRSVLKLDMTLPLAGEISKTHNQGLGYGLGLLIPLSTLGPLTISIAPKHYTTILPTTQAFADPIKLQGTSLALVPSLGPLSIMLGLGAFDIRSTRTTDARPALIGAVQLSLRQRRRQNNEAGLYTPIQIGVIRINNARPAIYESLTLLQAGLNLDLRR